MLSPILLCRAMFATMLSIMNAMHFISPQRNKSKYYLISRENQIEVLHPFSFELKVFEVGYIISL